MQPYWCIHFPSTDGPRPDAPYLPTQEQINRVLAPHQTIKERNLLNHVSSHLHDPFWIRTCYAPELQAAWEEILEEGLAEWKDLDELLVLNDENLYGGYGSDWTKIFLRLPMLPDAELYYPDRVKVDEEKSYLEPPKDEKLMPIFKASLADKQVVYLVDEEALKKKLVKLIHLDLRGQVVWHNTIVPENIWVFEANYYRGGMLSEIMMRFGGDDDGLILEPGTLLPYDD
jgi:hypothetical protein